MRGLVMLMSIDHASGAELAFVAAGMAEGGVKIEPNVAIEREYALHGMLERDGTLALGRLVVQRCDARGAWIEIVPAFAEVRRCDPSDGDPAALPWCGRGYRFTRLTPKFEGLVIRDREDLHAALPIHSANLEGRLSKRQELEIKMTVVGVSASAPRTWRAANLRGDCARATHVVSGLTVGAFEIVARASGTTSVGASALGASAGATRDVVNRDGRHEACAREARRRVSAAAFDPGSTPASPR